MILYVLSELIIIGVLKISQFKIYFKEIYIIDVVIKIFLFYNVNHLNSCNSYYLIQGAFQWQWTSF